MIITLLGLIKCHPLQQWWKFVAARKFFSLFVSPDLLKIKVRVIGKYLNNTSKSDTLHLANLTHASNWQNSNNRYKSLTIGHAFVDCMYQGQ